jgi:hypothetical protein
VAGCRALACRYRLDAEKQKNRILVADSLKRAEHAEHLAQHFDRERFALEYSYRRIQMKALLSKSIFVAVALFVHARQAGAQCPRSGPVVMPLPGGPIISMCGR